MAIAASQACTTVAITREQAKLVRNGSLITLFSELPTFVCCFDARNRSIRFLSARSLRQTVIRSAISSFADSAFQRDTRQSGLFFNTLFSASRRHYSINGQQSKGLVEFLHQLVTPRCKLAHLPMMDGVRWVIFLLVFHCNSARVAVHITHFCLFAKTLFMCAIFDKLRLK